VLCVTLYAVQPASLARIPEVYPRHHAYVQQFAADGDLVMIGPFADPATQGSMAVFRSRDAAERFVAGDPFVTEGIAVPEMRDWDALVLARVEQPGQDPAAAS
jgi:uncharacterized protein YciI